MFDDPQLDCDVSGGKFAECVISTSTVDGRRAVAYDTPRGSVIGSMPELNVLCAIADHSEQSGQPLTKQLIVEVTPAVTGPAT